MNVGTRESVALARALLLSLRGQARLPDVVACAAFPALSEVRKIVARSRVQLGAQDVFWEPQGNYTGEVSARMLTEHGVTHVIVGHSERRQIFGETDEMVGKKVAACFAAGITPIVCVGESAEQHEAGQTQQVIQEQLRTALQGAGAHKPFWVAYEPVWAIGSGKPALPEDVVAAHAAIRELVQELMPDVQSRVRVLYGGSVTGTNAYDFLREQNVDGVLVGGASVKVHQMADILTAAMRVMEAQA